MTTFDPFAGATFDFNSSTGQTFTPGPAASVRIGVPLDDFLASTDSMTWAVDGLAINGGIVVFAGRPESFKSTAAHNLGMTYARVWDGPWMGLDVAEGPVIYLTNEKAAGSIKDRLGKMRAAGDPPKHDFLVIHNLVRMTNDAPPKKEPWSALVATVEGLYAACGNRVMVIVDTLASCAPTGFNENDITHVQPVLDHLKEVRDAGATVILVHHFSKAGHGNGDDSMGMRGHTALYGDVDGTVIFTRSDPERPVGRMLPRPKDGASSAKPFSVDVDTDFRMVEANPGIVIALVTLDLIVDAVADGCGNEPKIIDHVKRTVPNATRAMVRPMIDKCAADGRIFRASKTAPWTVTEDGAAAEGARQRDGGGSDGEDDE